MKERNPIWTSLSLLADVVIAVLAIVRGPLQLPLLIAVFAVWGLWFALRFLPSRRAQPQQVEPFSTRLGQTLLHHVNYRVSACLKAAYPDARWEWMMRDPALFVAQGGTGRIRVYGIPDYEFADVTVDQNGKLSCSLVKLSTVEETAEQAVPPNEQDQDPQDWYDAQGRKTLERLVADLDSRGHSSLSLREDGSVCICPKDDGNEVKQGELPSFPAKDCWPKLAEILERESLMATVQDNCIIVAW